MADRNTDDELNDVEHEIMSTYVAICIDYIQKTLFEDFDVH